MILQSIMNLNYDTAIEGQIPVSDFNLIDNNYQRNVYIFPSETDQKIMDRFLELKENLVRENYQGKKEKDTLLLQIENIKSKLNQYRLSLSENDLKTYDGQVLPEQEYRKDTFYPYLYIPFQNVRYDPEIGFQKKSEEEQIEDAFI